MLVVWAIGAAITYIMLPVNWFMEIIGFLAVFTEAMLGKLRASRCPLIHRLHPLTFQAYRNSFVTIRISRHTA